MDLTPELKNLLGELHRRMGRNLTTYQAIEHALKMLLPHIATTESPATGVLELKGKLPTLGNLTKAYIDRVDAKWEGPSAGAMDVYSSLLAPIAKVVASRNRLVHTFVRAPGVDTYTRPGLQEGIRLLDEEYQEAQKLYDDFVPMLLVLMSALSVPEPERAGLELLKAVLTEYAKQRELTVFVHRANFSRARGSRSQVCKLAKWRWRVMARERAEALRLR